MPARRSRTQQWRRSLDEVCERGGSLEITVAGDHDDEGHREHGGHDVVWRVRLHGVSDDEVVVAQPTTLGSTIALEVGVEVIVALAIGQNRWMFRSTVLGDAPGRNDSKTMRLRLPAEVERCQRRNFYRVETAQIHLPAVDVWPLLDPRSVILAERANEDDAMRRATAEDAATDLLMPDVGPRFRATLVNLGGGGLGLDVAPSDANMLGRHKMYWMRFALPPDLSTPVCATAKLVHSHVQSNQHVYGGLAFDFSFNPEHQRFVIEQICRYIAVQQRAQVQRRRSA